MKKLVIILAAIAAILPAAAFADHYDGVYQGYGSNFISFGVGARPMRLDHGGDVRFVDHRGRRFNQRNLRRGHPIRVEYDDHHGRQVVRRVIVQERRSDDHGNRRGNH